VLTRGERAQLRALRAPEPRRLEWLAARTAAKEAVVRLVRAHAGVELQPADVELEPDDNGRPVVVGRAREALGAAPAVSLSHSDGEAVALAALGGRVGIDVERLRERPAGFADAAFGPDERRLLAGLPDEWTLRSWCAKEAVAKAVGSGLLQRPRDAAVVAIDRPQDRITVRLDGRSLIAHCSRHDDLIIATTLCDQEGSAA
jgi:phosphopantetheinyl transferase